MAHGFRLGRKDGTKYGWKMGGRGLNKTAVCRYNKNVDLDEDSEVTISTSEKVLKKVLKK